MDAVAKGNLLPSRMFLKNSKKAFFRYQEKFCGNPLLVSTQEYSQTNFFKCKWLQSLHGVKLNIACKFASENGMRHRSGEHYTAGGKT